MIYFALLTLMCLIAGIWAFYEDVPECNKSRLGYRCHHETYFSNGKWIKECD